MHCTNLQILSSASEVLTKLRCKKTEFSLGNVMSIICGNENKFVSFLEKTKIRIRLSSILGKRTRA